MSTRQIGITSLVFLLIYMIQEAIISQFRLPGGGFSILIIFALSWAIMSEREIAAVLGFSAGFLMDLSQNTSGPFGQWTLIMLLASYSISYLGYGDDNFRGNPISLVFTVAAAVVVIRIVYLILGLFLGSDIGSAWSVFLSLFSSAFWSAAIAPLLLPVVTRIHEALFDVKSRI